MWSCETCHIAVSFLLYAQVSAGHTVDSLPYDGTMVEAFSLTGHEFPAITSCSQQGSLMSTAPYQSNTPIVLEVPPTQQLGGTERMKRKRRKGLSQEQGVEASGSSTSAGAVPHWLVTKESVFTVFLSPLPQPTSDYSDNLPPSGEVYSMEPPPTESSYAQTDTPPQKLTWQAFIVDSWAMMCDPTLQPMWEKYYQHLQLWNYASITLKSLFIVAIVETPLTLTSQWKQRRGSSIPQWMSVLSARRRITSRQIYYICWVIISHLTNWFCRLQLNWGCNRLQSTWQLLWASGYLQLSLSLSLSLSLPHFNIHLRTFTLSHVIREVELSPFKN